MGFAVHVPHYLTQVEYPRAALVLLEEIAAAGELTLELDVLSLNADSSDRDIDAQVLDSPDNAEAVRGLEEQYDAMLRGAANALPLTELSDEPLPSGDEIAAQLEQFLREMDEDKGRSE